MRNLLVWLVVMCGALLGPASACAAETEVLTVAGGCFWCMEAAFDEVPGVVEAVSGYTGGTVPNPTYEQVSAHGTGHAEAVQVTFDPKVITYSQLLGVFWKNVDPTDAGGQFCDRGDPYRSEIFYHNEEQKKLAEESKALLEQTKTFKEPIVTKIVAAGPFYRAEEYHQHYHTKNPVRYKFYKWNCGRAQRLEVLWK